MQNFALKVKDHPKHYDPGYSLVQLTLVSVQKLEHPAVCLPTLKRERTLIIFKGKGGLL